MNESDVSVDLPSNSIKVFLAKIPSTFQACEDFYSIVAKVRRFKQLYKINTVRFFSENNFIFYYEFPYTLGKITKTEVFLEDVVGDHIFFTWDRNANKFCLIPTK